ncbi:MAG: hypothetical protein D3906_09040, partial [Candidatus Electrothrix sp. AUS1_2]|nr:hypothetical protein [Candidatus Electrothrix sp. AUS1_2]
QQYGLTERKFTEILKQQEEALVKEIRMSGTAGDKNKRKLLEYKLRDVWEKLADPQASFDQEIQYRKDADEAFARLSGHLPDDMIKKARFHLKQGDVEGAEQAFDAVADDGSEAACIDPDRLTAGGLTPSA